MARRGARDINICLAEPRVHPGVASDERLAEGSRNRNNNGTHTHTRARARVRRGEFHRSWKALSGHSKDKNHLGRRRPACLRRTGRSFVGKFRRVLSFSLSFFLPSPPVPLYPASLPAIQAILRGGRLSGRASRKLLQSNAVIVVDAASSRKPHLKHEILLRPLFFFRKGNTDESRGSRGSACVYFFIVSRR